MPDEDETTTQEAIDQCHDVRRALDNLGAELDTLAMLIQGTELADLTNMDELSGHQEDSYTELSKLRDKLEVLTND